MVESGTPPDVERFLRGRVFATREAAQHATKAPDVMDARRLQRGIGRQRHFASRAPSRTRATLIGVSDR